MGTQAISDPDDHDAPGEATLALLYGKGARPSAARLSAIAASSEAFALVFEPPPAEGWVEALITGLSFEVAGLAPTSAATAPEIAHAVGFDREPRWDRVEPVFVRAGPHLAGGESMLPVVRASLALACALAEASGPEAVAWLPARAAMPPRAFVEIARDWLAGGPFPALGLTALAADPGGALASEGLAFFIGQEIRIGAEVAASPGDRAKLAVRLIDRLIEEGPLATQARWSGLRGEALVATPSPDGATVSVQPAR